MHFAAVNLELSEQGGARQPHAPVEISGEGKFTQRKVLSGAQSNFDENADAPL